MPPTTPPPTRAAVPLGVWPCAQAAAPARRAGRYLPAGALHPGTILPELARRIVTAFSAPGALVVDPRCGSGTTLVEAAALGRRCVGVEREPRWAALARATLARALPAEQAALAEVRVGDAQALPSLLGGLAGQADLVVTSPPHARGAAYQAAMARVYAGCFAALRPGGLLVTVTQHSWPGGRLLDRAALTVELAGQAGFGYLQHLVALHAAVRDGRLLAHPPRWQSLQLRRRLARGEPAHLVVHEDVLVFRKPEAARA